MVDDPVTASRDGPEDDLLPTLRQILTSNSVETLFEESKNSTHPGDNFGCALIAAYLIHEYWGYDAPPGDYPTDPDEVAHFPIPVPWWIIKQIGEAWPKYEKAPTGKTFGETLEFEGGAGKRPGNKRWAKWIRNNFLAAKVYETRLRASAADQHISIEKAIAAVAEQHDSTESIVRRAWRKHRPKRK